MNSRAKELWEFPSGGSQVSSCVFRFVRREIHIPRLERR
jgi:hypothetical protein